MVYLCRQRTSDALLGLWARQQATLDRSIYQVVCYTTLVVFLWLPKLSLVSLYALDNVSVRQSALTRSVACFGHKSFQQGVGNETWVARMIIRCGVREVKAMAGQRAGPVETWYCFSVRAVGEVGPVAPAPEWE
jgi:hypothetical protein